jgi:hypothetical protein
MTTIFRSVGLCLTIVLPTVLHAQITGVSGDVTVIPAPPTVEFSVGTGAASWVFTEQQNAVLTSSLAVDVAVPGTYGNYTNLPSTAAGTIAAGTPVESFYLHSYNLSNLSGTDYSGSITFATPILGVEGLDASLVASNFLGAPGTKYYSSSQGQGFEFLTNIDSFTWSGETITFSNETFDASDDLRIITLGTATPPGVPEPATVSLLALGMGALGFRKRNKI